MPQNPLDTDLFNGTNTNVLSTYSSNWHATAGDHNECTIRGTPGVGGQLAANYKTGFTWTNDQFVSITVDASSSLGIVIVQGVGVRFQTGSVTSGYFGGVDTGQHSGGTPQGYLIVRYDANAKTKLAEVNQAMALSDVVNFQVVGTTLTLAVNGTTLITYDTVSDGTTYSSGNPAILLNDNAGTARRAGSWSAGSVTGEPGDPELKEGRAMAFGMP